MNSDQWDIVYKNLKAKHFELAATNTLSWKSSSLNLKRAADKLYDVYYVSTIRALEKFGNEIMNDQIVSVWKKLDGDELEDHLDGELITVYFLLIGYAFENLLKAIIIHRHPDYFDPNTKITKIKSHNLVNLCEKCKIELSNKEENLLKELFIYVDWLGKYPIPLESEKMFPLKQGDGSWKTRGVAFSGRKTQEEIDALYIKILQEVDQ